MGKRHHKTSKKSPRRAASLAVNSPILGVTYYDPLKFSQHPAIPTPHRSFQAPTPKTLSGIQTIENFLATGQQLPLRERL